MYEETEMATLLGLCMLLLTHMYAYTHVYIHIYIYVYMCMKRPKWRHCSGWRGGGLGSRPKKMYGERLGDGVEYHLMSPTPRRYIIYDGA